MVEEAFAKFDENGDPLKPEAPSFVTFSAKHKEHTRYFHVNNFTKLRLPEARRPSNVGKSSVEAFFQRMPAGSDESSLVNRNTVRDISEQEDSSSDSNSDSEPVLKRSRDELFDEDSNSNDRTEFENTAANRILIPNDDEPVHEMNNNLGDSNLSQATLVKEISEKILEK